MKRQIGMVLSIHHYSLDTDTSDKMHRIFSIRHHIHLMCLPIHHALAPSTKSLVYGSQKSFVSKNLSGFFCISRHRHSSPVTPPPTSTSMRNGVPAVRVQYIMAVDFIFLRFIVDTVQLCQDVCADRTPPIANDRERSAELEISPSKR